MSSGSWPSRSNCQVDFRWPGRPDDERSPTVLRKLSTRGTAAGVRWSSLVNVADESAGERMRSPRVRLLRCLDRLLVLVRPSIASTSLFCWTLTDDVSSVVIGELGVDVVVVLVVVVVGANVVVLDEILADVKERPDDSVVPSWPTCT